MEQSSVTKVQLCVYKGIEVKKVVWGKDNTFWIGERIRQ